MRTSAADFITALEQEPVELTPEELENLELFACTDAQLQSILALLAEKEVNGKPLGQFVDVLELNDNQLTQIPDSIKNLSELTGLSISNNKVSDLPSCLKNMTKITALELSYNQFESFPDVITDMPALCEIYITGNQISRLPESIGNLTNLEALYIEYNNLKELPESFTQLKSLTELNLSDNQLSIFPNAVTNLTQLTMLGLSQNGISEITETIGNLENLEKLDLSDNNLSSLPAQFGKLTSLEKLGLNGNQLTNLPEAFKNLNSLEWLNLSYNKLNEFPNEILELSNIKHLNLSINKIPFIPPDIHKLKQLNELILSYNHLSELPCTIGELTQLTSLDLNHNVLLSLPDEFEDLTELQMLDISHNEISTPLSDEFVEKVEIIIDENNQYNRTLKDMANNPESAMHRLNEAQQGFVSAITQQYHLKYVEQTQKEILNNLKINLLDIYHNNPVLDENNQPIPWDITKAEIDKLDDGIKHKFYNHRAHTVLRYLYMRPNPWIDIPTQEEIEDFGITPQADIADLGNNTFAANINDHDLRHIAYLWLAVTDKSIVPLHNASLADMQTLLIEQLYIMARQHNIGPGEPENYKTRGDRPTCAGGVEQQYMRSLIYHPLMEMPEARPLDADIIADKIQEELTSEAFKVYLKTLSLEKCEQLNNALVKKFIMLDDLSSDEQKIIDNFKIPTILTKGFIDECKAYYTAHRINNKTKRYHGKRYDNYEKLIEHIATNPWDSFFQPLSHLLEHHVKELKEPGDMALGVENKSVVTRKTKHKAFKSKSDNTDDLNQKHQPANSPADVSASKKG